jgi:alpha,alpha-trehalase
VVADVMTAGFPPHVLRDYALLADGCRGALVGPRGDIAWLCAPRWDSDAVFSSLLGGRGVFAVTPSAERFVWGGYYTPGSLVWNSRWVSTSGIIESRDALAYPADPRCATLMRRVRGVGGPAEVRVVLDVAAGFGRYPWDDLRQVDEVWTGRTGGLGVRLTGAGEANIGSDGVLEVVLAIPAGGHHDLVLEIVDGALPDRPPDPRRLWTVTDRAWAAGTTVTSSVAPREVRLASAVLRGLTSPSGGMVAAVTMALPERAERGRNYDYRYAWIRDQCFAGQAAAVAGLDDLLDSAVGFVSGRLLADGSTLAPAYTVTGETVPAERQLPLLPGYPGASVKAGNWVRGQLQLDAFGEALLLFARAAQRDRMNRDAEQAMHVAAAAIRDRWQEPDAGIWELDARQWTHSKLACVAGLRAAAGSSAAGQAVAEWNGLADAILAKVSASSVHPSGRWQRTPDDPRVDAALLLPSVRGAVPAEDPRSRATLAAVREQLKQDGYVYRFQHDGRQLGEAEGAFVLCGFLTALAEHQAGHPLAATRLFERNLAACGSPGLYSEEYDVTQRQLRGNLPQAFVHALLLETAVALSQ